MGKKSSKVPQPVPVEQVTAAQTQANLNAIKESAKINAVDVYNPYGSTTYQKDENGVPISQTTTLNDDSQYIYDQQQNIGKKLADTANSRLDGITQSAYSMDGVPYDPRNVNTGSMPMFGWSSMARGNAGGVGGQSPTSPYGAINASMATGGNPSAPATPPGSPPAGSAPGGATPASTTDPSAMPYDPRSYGDMNYFQNDVGNAIYDQGMSRIDPRIETQNRQFDQQMADRGIPLGSEAYNRAKSEMTRGQNDLVSSLANQATVGSLDATKGIVGLEQGLRGTAWNENLQGSQQQQKDWLTKLQTEQGLRGTINQEDLTERNQGINEVAAILQGSPALGMPNAPAIPTYQMQNTDVIGATNANYKAQMSAYDAQQKQNASMWQGAFGVAKAALPIMMSHPDFKEVLADA